MTDKPYRSLENTIREQTRKAMQDKLDARMKLTTKVMEQPKPEPLKEAEIEKETEVEEATRKDQIDDIGRYHSRRMAKNNPTSKYHTIMRNRASRIKSMINHTGPNPEATKSKEGRKTMLKYAAQDSKAAKATPGSPTQNQKKLRAFLDKNPDVAPEIKRTWNKEEIEVNELAPGTSNNIDTSAKLDAQRKRMQAQKQAILQQQQKKKQSQAAQDAKDRAMEQDELKKAQMKEAELDERVHFGRVHNYERATKLINLHTRLYNRLAAAGDMQSAEKHRKKAVEYKRIQYQAKDNPGKLPSV